MNPSLDNISGWISAVGAVVALNDIDEDGLPNDVCYIDRVQTPSRVARDAIPFALVIMT